MSDSEGFGCSNLPSWPKASEVYSKAYGMLAAMAANGHVTKMKLGRSGTSLSCIKEHGGSHRRPGQRRRGEIKGLIINFQARGLCIPAHSAERAK